MTHRKRHIIFWRWLKWVDGQCGRLSSYFEILETTTPTTSAAALFHCLKQQTTTVGWKGSESRNPSRTTWRFIRWQTWKNFLSVQIKIQKEIAHHSPFNVLRYHTVIHQGKEADKLTSWGKTYCDQGLSANIQRDTSLHLPKKRKCNYRRGRYVKSHIVWWRYLEPGERMWKILGGYTLEQIKGKKLHLNTVNVFWQMGCNISTQRIVVEVDGGYTKQTF